MSINSARSVRWIQTFAQIMEVDEQHLHPRKKNNPAAAERRLPVIAPARRASHD